MDAQLIIVLGLAAGAALYLIRRGLRAARGRAGSCGCGAGAGCCPANRRQDGQ
ncbi:MAG: FeoB-associated Cys-rich membrane protein [Candidatus Adiutrix sp.]|jgi:hypothetical protein|nr:FeoB-associated Cys-rich membrane protein [Candidatus Adiutrix sp.]